MNFFFRIKKNGLRTKLSIPKFSNQNLRSQNFELFAAYIKSDKWKVQLANCKTDSNFWYVDEPTVDDNEIFFLATELQAKTIETQNSLLDLNSFTDTLPDFRANLCVETSEGGFSSYQSEYPFRMALKFASLYSDCGVLSHSNCKKAGVFIKNVHVKPAIKNRMIHLFDNKANQLLSKFCIATNACNYLDLTPYKDRLSDSFLFADDYIGIPIYLTEYENGALSLEHTHPPHESVFGPERFYLVKRLKENAREKINQNTI